MKAALTQESFAALLLFLDADRERAGEKYEDLRRTLIRFFEWRGAPFPEDHADETLSRVGHKLSEGIQIRNISNYCYEVARLVLLETLKSHDKRRQPLESVQSELVTLADTLGENEEREARLACLDDCLRSLPHENSELILEYYRYEERGKIERRKALAERFGLRREALANRVQRLRDKLQYCVSACVKKKTAI